MTTIHGIDGATSSDPKLIRFHESRDSPISVRCLRDDPPMRGFGRRLKTGDVVVVQGTVSEGGKFQVAVPAECAFYDYEYFEEA